MVEQSTKSSQTCPETVENSNIVITCSADKTCKIIDPLSGYRIRGQMQCKDAVYSLASAYNVTVAGCGDGNLLFFDNDTQKCLYGYSQYNLDLVPCNKEE